MNRLIVVFDPSHAAPRWPGIGARLTKRTRVTFLVPLGGALIIDRELKDAFPLCETIECGPELRGRRTHLESELTRGKARSRVDIIRHRAGSALLRLTDGWLSYPDTHRKWGHYCFRALCQFRPGDGDVVVSSSSPVTTHIAAARAVRRFPRTFWVADMRDPWSQNHYYPFSPLRRFVDRLLERYTLRRAALITTVSEPVRALIEKLHPNIPTAVLTNGFADARFECRERERSGPVRIVYTGQIYWKRQRPEIPIRAIQQLLDDCLIDAGDIELCFFGVPFQPMAKHLRQAGITRIPSFVKMIGAVSREEALEAQCNADLLLLLNWEDHKFKGVLFTKFWEYLATGTPTMATGGPGGDSVYEVLDRTKAGHYCRTVTQTRSLIALYCKNRELPAFNPNREAILRHSYRNLALNFCDLVDAVSPSFEHRGNNSITPTKMEA